MTARFFSDESGPSGPALTDEMVSRAEDSLGVRLPRSYLALLHERNGGIPVRRCFPMKRPTSWASDHIQVSTLLGIGFEEGIDGELGSRYLIQEWGYPDVGVVIFDMPSGGHDTVMLDYSDCGSHGEPRVVYVDEDRIPVFVAATFEEFVEALVDCSRFGAS